MRRGGGIREGRAGEPGTAARSLKAQREPVAKMVGLYRDYILSSGLEKFRVRARYASQEGGPETGRD